MEMRRGVQARVYERVQTLYDKLTATESEQGRRWSSQGEGCQGVEMHRGWPRIRISGIVVDRGCKPPAGRTRASHIRRPAPLFPSSAVSSSRQDPAHGPGHRNAIPQPPSYQYTTSLLVSWCGPQPGQDIGSLQNKRHMQDEQAQHTQKGHLPKRNSHPNSPKFP